jgi:hypothetical protein
VQASLQLVGPGEVTPVSVARIEAAGRRHQVNIPQVGKNVDDILIVCNM